MWILKFILSISPTDIFNFLVKYWKEVLVVATILAFSYLYVQNNKLETSLEQSEMALEASQKAIEALQEDRARIERINKENALNKAKIQSDLNKSKAEISKLRQELIERNEKGSECYNVDIPHSDNEWMREQSKNRDSLH